MIVIGANHYDLAKAQAHELRDHLINSCLLELEDHSLIKKSAFLNVWGKSLGYKDWNDFKHAACSRHATSEKNTIITPDAIAILARNMTDLLYLHDDDACEIERLLFATAMPHERALFTDEDCEFYAIAPGTESNPIKLELGPSRQVHFLLELMMRYHGSMNQIEITRVGEILLREAKEARKSNAYSKSDAKIAGVDIYANSGCRANTLISTAVDEGWLEKTVSYAGREPTDVIELSDRSSWWLFSYFTESNKAKWVEWNLQVDSALMSSQRGRRIESKFDRLKAYADTTSAEVYSESILAPPYDEMSERMNEGIKGLSKAIQSDIARYSNENEVFHLLPRLFLSEAEFYNGVAPKDLTVDVSIQFFDSKGVALMALDNFEFALKTPYPNKRHIVGVGVAGHIGTFISVPQNANRIECSFVWADRVRGRNTIHNQTFNLNRHCGNSIFTAGHIQAYSFLDPTAITGCAQTQEQMMTLKRFKEQITSIRSEPSSGEWKRQSELHEEVVLDATSAYGEWFLLS